MALITISWRSLFSVGFLVTVLLFTTVGAERPEEEEAFETSGPKPPEAGLTSLEDRTSPGAAPVTNKEKESVKDSQATSIDIPKDFFENKVPADPASAPKPARAGGSDPDQSNPGAAAGGDASDNLSSAPSLSSQPSGQAAAVVSHPQKLSDDSASAVSNPPVTSEGEAPKNIAAAAGGGVSDDLLSSHSQEQGEAKQGADGSLGSAPQDAEAREKWFKETLERKWKLWKEIEEDEAKEEADHQRLAKEEATAERLGKEEAAERATAERLAEEKAAAEQVQAAHEEALEDAKLDAATAPQEEDPKEDAAKGVEVLSEADRKAIEGKAKSGKFELGQKKGFDDLTAAYEKMSETYKAASDIAWTNPESSEGKTNRIEQSGKSWMNQVNAFRNQSSELKATAKELSQKIVHAHEFAAKQQQETFKQEQARLKRLLRNHADIQKTSGDHATNGFQDVVSVPDGFFKEEAKDKPSV